MCRIYTVYLFAYQYLIILSFSLCLSSAVSFTVFLFFVRFTQQPPCPPGAAADSPACPHNDSNCPITHWDTQKHRRVGLGSVLSIQSIQDEKISQNLNFEHCFLCFWQLDFFPVAMTQLSDLFCVVFKLLNTR